jgi:release factor glutamine methyltransferase
MTIGEGIRTAEERLRVAGVDTPRLDSQVLAALVCGKTRSWVLAHPGTLLPEVFWDLIERRENREPLAYITGEREFYGRPFFVDRRVLIPRQETETVIASALAFGGSAPRILDLGTGSGCLAVTLALEMTGAQVTAVDASEDALAVARLNATRHGASIECVNSWWMSRLPAQAEFDMIVSNPPYVAHGEIHQPEVLHWEPAVALYSERSGMADYRQILEHAPDHLAPEGCLILEVGDHRWHDLEKLAKNLDYKLLDLRRDLSGAPRAATFGLKPN